MPDNARSGKSGAGKGPPDSSKSATGTGRGRGQGDRGGWPSTTGKVSGRNRSNAPPAKSG